MTSPRLVQRTSRTLFSFEPQALDLWKLPGDPKEADEPRRVSFNSDNTFFPTIPQPIIHRGTPPRPSPKPLVDVNAYVETLTQLIQHSQSPLSSPRDPFARTMLPPPYPIKDRSVISCAKKIGGFDYSNSFDERSVLNSTESKTAEKGDNACNVCFEAVVDAVFVKCGHMGTCYKCGVEQWVGKGNGKCPFCLVDIASVLRVYQV